MGDGVGVGVLSAAAFWGFTEPLETKILPPMAPSAMSTVTATEKYNPTLLNIYLQFSIFFPTILTTKDRRH